MTELEPKDLLKKIRERARKMSYYSPTGSSIGTPIFDEMLQLYLEARVGDEIDRFREKAVRLEKENTELRKRSVEWERTSLNQRSEMKRESVALGKLLVRATDLFHKILQPGDILTIEDNYGAKIRFKVDGSNLGIGTINLAQWNGNSQSWETPHAITYRLFLEEYRVIDYKRSRKLNPDQSPKKNDSK